MNAAVPPVPYARRCVRLPILVAALLLVVGTVLTGSGLSRTAQAQAERGAVPSLTLASSEPGQLAITWETPEPEPTDYRLTWAHTSLGFLSYKHANEAQRGNVHPAGNETTMTPNNLSPGGEYKVKLRARYYNADRSVHEWSGPWTPPATNRVMDDPPPAPTGLAAARVGHESLTLTWDDPQDARITGYRVLRGTDAESLSTIAPDTRNAGMEYTDATVAAETTYFYAVLALSPGGDGTQSNTISATTQAQRERGAIPSLTLASSELGQLVITWETPDPEPTDFRISWAHVSLGYLSYRDSNVEERANVYPAGDETTLTLNGLAPGEEYKVQLRARYTGGDHSDDPWSGPWSEEAILATAGDPPAKPAGPPCLDTAG